MTISTGSDAGLFDMNFGGLNNISYDFSNSSFDNEISFNDLKIDEEIILTDSEFELDKEALIDMVDDVIILDKSEHVEPKNINFDMTKIHDLSNTEKINILEDVININNDIILFSSNLQPITDLANLNFLEYINKNFEYTKTIDGDLNMVEEHSLTNSQFFDFFEFNVNKPVSFNSNTLVNENNLNYDILYSNMFSFTSTFNESSLNLDLDYKTIYNLTSTHNENNFDFNLNQNNVHDFSNSEFIQDKEGVFNNKTIIGNNSDLSLTWGTSSNDTHFINFQETLPSSKRNKGVNSDYNVNYYEDRFNFITIGNQTVFSSLTNSAGNSFVDFENHKFVLNEKLHTDGRKIGVTHKISSSDGGVITYPENHFIKIGTSKTSIRHSFYDGSKNGITVQDENNNLIYASAVQFPHGLDIQPTSSFYTISVGGADTDTILRVEKPGDRTKT